MLCRVSEQNHLRLLVPCGDLRRFLRGLLLTQQLTPLTQSSKAGEAFDLLDALSRSGAEANCSDRLRFEYVSSLDRANFVVDSQRM